MKYKKYIILLLLVVAFGCNMVYASTNFEIAAITDNGGSEDDKYEDPCVGLFGDRNDPDSLNYLINEILQYPKIIVPIIDITLIIITIFSSLLLFIYYLIIFSLINRCY